MTLSVGTVNISKIVVRNMNAAGSEEMMNVNLFKFNELNPEAPENIFENHSDTEGQ